MQEQQRERCPYLRQRRVFVIQRVVPGHKMVVTRRDVGDLIDGDALALDHHEEIGRHGSQQHEDDQLRPVPLDEKLAFPQNRKIASLCFRHSGALKVAYWTSIGSESGCEPRSSNQQTC